MSLSQYNVANQFAHTPTATATDQRKHAKIGDMEGVFGKNAKANHAQVLHLNLRTLSDQVIASEQWSLGDSLWWNEAGQVWSKSETSGLHGWASYDGTPPSDNIVKAVGALNGQVSFRSQPTSGGAAITVDFAALPALGLVGSFIVRAYSPDAQINSLVMRHDGALAPAGATIEVGTIADPDAFFVAADMTTLMALGLAFNDIPVVLSPLVIAAPEIQITVSVAAITAGKVSFTFGNGAL